MKEIRKIVRDLIFEIDNSKNENLNELGGQYKDEVEIIYRDSNVVCLIPKSQMASKIYGKGTEWCQVYSGGFKMWSQTGLLIRFIFKDGTKIRFTYFFKPMKAIGGSDDRLYDFYWATEKKQHLFHGNGDPFDFSQFSNDAEKRLGRNIISKLNIIPEECKNKVREFIKKNRESYDYCYRDREYLNYKEAKRKELYDKKQQEYREFFLKLQISGLHGDMHILRNFRIQKKRVFTIDYSEDYKTNQFKLEHSIKNLNPNLNYETKTVYLNNLEELNKEIEKVVKEMWKIYSKIEEENVSNKKLKYA